MVRGSNSSTSILVSAMTVVDCGTETGAGVEVETELEVEVEAETGGKEPDPVIALFNFLFV